MPIVFLLKSAANFDVLAEGAPTGGVPPNDAVASAQQPHLAALSGDGRLLVFPLAQMKRLSGGKGVQIIALKGNETLAQTLISPGPFVKIRGVFRGKTKEIRSETQEAPPDLPGD